MKNILFFLSFLAVFMLAGCTSTPTEETVGLPPPSPALVQECKEYANEQISLSKEYATDGVAPTDDPKAYETAYNRCLMVGSMKANLPAGATVQNQDSYSDL